MRLIDRADAKDEANATVDKLEDGDQDVEDT
jgi:hypothetical protein